MTGGVARWLKANLAVSTAALALASAVGGSLISVTLFYSQITMSERTHTTEIASLHHDMQSVDGRLNVVTDALNSADKRMALLEAQLKWAGQHIEAGAVRRPSR